MAPSINKKYNTLNILLDNTRPFVFLHFHLNFSQYQTALHMYVIIMYLQSTLVSHVNAETQYIYHHVIIHL